MKKETQYLCLILLCCISLGATGCGIRPADLSPPVKPPPKTKEDSETTLTPTERPSSPAETASRPFPAIYPKPAR